MISGSLTALITPFRDGEVDAPAFEQFVNWQIEAGSHGLVPCGTSGESPTLSHEEHMHVVELCVKTAAGRVPVIAGAGSNSTEEAVMFTRHAAEVGADAVLSVTPYYNKPTQEGIYQHFRAVHDAAEIPVILYNIPGRSVVDIGVETMARLFELPRIIGVKDATGDIARTSAQRRAMGPDFLQLSGEDATALAVMAHGGQGCISVTANVAPKLCAAFQTACMNGDFAEALRLQDILYPLHRALFVEASPAPTKCAAALLDLCSEEVRLPMVPISEGSRQQVRSALLEAGLLAA